LILAAYKLDALNFSVALSQCLLAVAFFAKKLCSLPIKAKQLLKTGRFLTDS